MLSVVSGRKINYEKVKRYLQGSVKSEYNYEIFESNRRYDSEFHQNQVQQSEGWQSADHTVRELKLAVVITEMVVYSEGKVK